MDRPDLHFTADFGANVTISAKALSMMAEFARKRCRRETGGILVGHYSDDLTTARVEFVSDEPPDSRAGRTWFVRGKVGLAAMLEQAWDEGRYYLGEWHSHPGSSATPSGPDLSSITKLARDRALVCRRPILVIIGGDLRRAPDISATLGSATLTEAMRATTGAALPI